MTDERDTQPAESLRRSQADVSAPEDDQGMGTSSERTGRVGSEPEATDGLRDTAAAEGPSDDAPPEQHAAGDEQNPEGLAPKAGYPAKDPRHEHHGWRPEGADPDGE